MNYCGVNHKRCDFNDDCRAFIWSFVTNYVDCNICLAVFTFVFTSSNSHDLSSFRSSLKSYSLLVILYICQYRVSIDVWGFSVEKERFPMKGCLNGVSPVRMISPKIPCASI